MNDGLIRNEDPTNAVQPPVVKDDVPMIDGKPLTVEAYKELQTKVESLAKVATDLDATKKERDDAKKQLVDLQTRQETLEQMIGGKGKKQDVSLSDMPEPVIIDGEGEAQMNPLFLEYLKTTGTTVKELQSEIARLKQVAGATGVQNVSHGNAILKREFRDTHNIAPEELSEIIDLGIKANIIPSYPVGNKQEPIIENIEQLEKAKALKLVNELQSASKKGDMKAIQELISKNYIPKASQTAPRISGGGDVDKTDAEKKFQLMAVGKMNIGEFTETEVDELIRKGYMSEHTKNYRWKQAKKT